MRHSKANLGITHMESLFAGQGVQQCSLFIVYTNCLASQLSLRFVCAVQHKSNSLPHDKVKWEKCLKDGGGWRDTRLKQSTQVSMATLRREQSQRYLPPIHNHILTVTSKREGVERVKAQNKHKRRPKQTAHSHTAGQQNIYSKLCKPCTRLHRAWLSRKVTDQDGLESNLV